MVDGVLFDLDGTLWDAVDSICAAWNQGLEECGQTRRFQPEQVRACMGMLLRDIADRLMPWLEPEERQRVMAECARRQAEYLAVHGGRLYPRLEETLERLAGRYPLFVVSNCQSGYIEGFFAVTGLGRYFRDFECPGRTGLDKAANIRLVTERNGLKHPVYVGDTQGDCCAAEAAGVPFIHAAYGFGTVEGKYPVLRAFGDLPGLLAGLHSPGEDGFAEKQEEIPL